MSVAVEEKKETKISYLIQYSARLRWDQGRRQSDPYAGDVIVTITSPVTDMNPEKRLERLAADVTNRIRLVIVEAGFKSSAQVESLESWVTRNWMDVFIERWSIVKEERWP